jgi:hypothetical protein
MCCGLQIVYGLSCAAKLRSVLTSQSLLRAFLTWIHNQMTKTTNDCSRRAVTEAKKLPDDHCTSEPGAIVPPTLRGLDCTFQGFAYPDHVY